jgi:hypothetical protein
VILSGSATIDALVVVLFPGGTRRASCVSAAAILASTQNVSASIAGKNTALMALQRGVLLYSSRAEGRMEDLAARFQRLGLKGLSTMIDCFQQEAEMAQTNDNEPFPGQAVLMLSVALEDLQAIEAEPDLSKVRARILGVESTLKELLELAKKATKPSRLGL